MSVPHRLVSGRQKVVGKTIEDQKGNEEGN